jgi:hypothetical protein
LLFLENKRHGESSNEVSSLDTYMLSLKQEAATVSIRGLARLTRWGRGSITLPRERKNPA